MNKQRKSAKKAAEDAVRVQSSTAKWFDGHSINEPLFLMEFVEKHYSNRLRCESIRESWNYNECLFFLTKTEEDMKPIARVSCDEIQAKIFQELADGGVETDLAYQTDNLFKALQLMCYTEVSEDFFEDLEGLMFYSEDFFEDLEDFEKFLNVKIVLDENFDDSEPLFEFDIPPDDDEEFN